jgi:hypothetical protein
MIGANFQLIRLEQDARQEIYEEVYEACINGDLPSLKRLLNRDTANNFYIRGFRTLGLCCREGHLDCVKWLVEEMGVKHVSSLEHAKTYDTVEYILDKKLIADRTRLSIILRSLIFLNETANTTYTIHLLMRHGARLPDKDTHEETVIRNSENAGLYLYQQMLDIKWKNCVRAAYAVAIVCKRADVPKDVRKHIGNNYVLSTWLDYMWLDGVQSEEEEEDAKRLK